MGYLLKLFTGNPISMLWVIGGVALGAFALGGSAAWTVQGWRLDAANAKYEVFVTKTEAAGKVQDAASKAKDAANKLKQEKANEENLRTKRALTVALNSLRNSRPGSSFVPAAPAGAVRPDLACYSRPEFVGAVGSFIEAARGLADEGTAAAIDLNTARQWATQPK